MNECEQELMKQLARSEFQSIKPKSPFGSSGLSGYGERQ